MAYVPTQRYNVPLKVWDSNVYIPSTDIDSETPEVTKGKEGEM